MFYGYGYSLGRVSGGGVVPFDADAQAFITAASITDATQKSAVNQLVLDLKAASIWTKMNRLYIPIFGNATSNKYNLKNPLDTNGAGRLTFSGGWTHGATGLLGNASNSYANTWLDGGFTTYNDIHLSVYVGNNTQDGYDIGASADASAIVDELILISRYSNGKAYYSFDNGYALNVTQADSKGLTLGTYNASNNRLYKNGVEIGSSAVTATVPPTGYSLVLGACNAAGTPLFFSGKEYRFVSIGGALSATEQGNLYTAVQSFMTTLSLNV